jgi:hypothetical protein
VDKEYEKKKKYHNVGTNAKSNLKFVETDKIDTFSTHSWPPNFFLLATDISMRSGGVKKG